MSNSQIQTTDNGRINGKFGLGNRAAVGHSSHGKRLRAAVLGAIGTDDVDGIVKKLIELATDGDIKAAKLILDFIGRPKLNERPVVVMPPLPPMPLDIEAAKAILIARCLRIQSASAE